MYVPKQQRKALDDGSEECVLIGYGSRNINRLLTEKTRNVMFDETSLGLVHVRNKGKPLRILDDDDDEHKKKA